MRAISRFFTAILVTLLLESSVMAQIYESVDDQGNPVFSDTPSTGSEKVELPAQNIADAPPPSTRAAESPLKPQTEQSSHQHKTEKYQAGTEITREGSLQLMEECQKQREEHIAPLRDQAIEDCVTKKQGDRGYCERFNRTFGDPTRHGRVGVTPGMFWDLPICQKADAAEQYFKSNPGSRTYSLP
jgi:uncharacterized protein DUF4124